MVLLLVTLLLLLSTPVFAKNCPPTAPMSSGTHYKQITQKRVNIGKGLLVSGKILSSSDCKPITGAKIAHWQANNKGIYEDRLRAYLYSGKDGRYQFQTEWPAAFIPHLHFRVSAKGYRRLSTQWIGDKKTDRIKFTIVLKPQ